ncbi:MAG: STAS domain-containing protein [Candidatus Delongbacteria bacterium]|nr:STAS domain-containing protein [Candidatus Delongbacteria bacterium]
MDVKLRKKSGIAILDLAGRMDINASDSINRNIDEILEEGGRKILLNFNQIDFVSSPGLVILVSILKKIRKMQGRIVLCNLQSYVKEVFEVTQLTKVFDVFDDEPTAIDNLQKD